MKINKKELQEALTIVKPGLASKEILEQTTSFAFIDNRVVTYNDEISISHPVGDIDFEGAVKAEELYGLLSRVSKEEVELEADGDILKFSCGRVKAGLRLDKEVFLPIKEPPKRFHKLANPDQFVNFVSLAMRTCSNDISQPRLTCVFVENGGKIIGTDSFRFIQCDGEEMPVEDFLIPAPNAFELVKTNPTHIALDEHWLYFKNEDGTMFSCRRMIDEYVPQEKIDKLFRFKKEKEVVFPKKIEEMLETVKKFSKRGFALDEIVEVLIKEGKVLLRAEAEDTKSWVTEEASIKYKKKLSFIITPSLFEYILKINRAFFLDQDITKMRFTGPDWQYVILLREEG